MCIRDRSFIDENMESALSDFVKLYRDAAPGVKRASTDLDDTDGSIKNIEDLIKKWNGSAEGRQVFGRVHYLHDVQLQMGYKHVMPLQKNMT